jgi:hypothetical protein
MMVGIHSKRLKHLQTYLNSIQTVSDAQKRFPTSNTFRFRFNLTHSPQNKAQKEVKRERKMVIERQPKGVIRFEFSLEELSAIFMRNLSHKRLLPQIK